MGAEHAGGQHSGNRQGHIDAHSLGQGDDDGQGDDVHAPVGAGDELRDGEHDEHDQGQELRRHQAGAGVDDILREVDLTVDTGKQEGQDHEQQGQDHALEALQADVHEFLRGHQALDQVEREHEAQGNDDAQLHIRAKHAFLEIRAGEDGRYDQHEDGDEHVPDAALFGDLYLFTAVNVDLLAVGRGQGAAVLDALEGLLHGADGGNDAEDGQRHDERGDPAVEIIGNGLDEVGQALAGGSPAVGLQQAADKDCPGGDGDQNANRSGSRVDHIGEELSGHLVLVRELGHAGAHGEGVEIVVDEDDDAQDPGPDQRGFPGLCLGGGPPAKGEGAAGLLDEGNDGAHQTADDDQPGGILIHHRIQNHLAEGGKSVGRPHALAGGHGTGHHDHADHGSQHQTLHHALRGKDIGDQKDGGNQGNGAEQRRIRRQEVGHDHRSCQDDGNTDDGADSLSPRRRRNRFSTQCTISSFIFSSGSLHCVFY